MKNIIKFGVSIVDIIFTGGALTTALSISEIIYGYGKEVNDIRVKNCLKALQEQLITNEKLDKEQLQTLIKGDTTYFFSDILTQAMLTQSPKLQALLGIIYAEYLKSDNKKSQCLRFFNAVKQITEIDFDVFCNILKQHEISSEYEEAVVYKHYSESELNATPEIIKATQEIINQSNCGSFDNLRLSIHQLSSVSLLFFDTRSGFPGNYDEPITFGITQFSKDCYVVSKRVFDMSCSKI